MAETRGSADKPAEKPTDKPAPKSTKADRDEVLARAAGSSDAAVHDLLAHRAIAVLNDDRDAIDGIDEVLAKLVD